MLETDEPALVLHYPTSTSNDQLWSEVKEVWTVFRPIVEKEKLSLAVIFQDSGGGGSTWIWKRDENGSWSTLDDHDKGRTPNGLHSADLISAARRAQAIVHLRLVFAPGPEVVDPRYQDLKRQAIDQILLVKTLKRTPDFLGEQAFAEACAAWRPGEKVVRTRSAVGHVDYLVLNTLPATLGTESVWQVGSTWFPSPKESCVMWNGRSAQSPKAHLRTDGGSAVPRPFNQGMQLTASARAAGIAATWRGRARGSMLLAP